MDGWQCAFEVVFCSLSTTTEEGGEDKNDCNLQGMFRKCSEKREESNQIKYIVIYVLIATVGFREVHRGGILSQDGQTCSRCCRSLSFNTTNLIRPVESINRPSLLKISESEHFFFLP